MVQNYSQAKRVIILNSFKYLNQNQNILYVSKIGNSVWQFLIKNTFKYNKQQYKKYKKYNTYSSSDQNINSINPTCQCLVPMEPGYRLQVSNWGAWGQVRLRWVKTIGDLEGHKVTVLKNVGMVRPYACALDVCLNVSLCCSCG